MGTAVMIGVGFRFVLSSFVGVFSEIFRYS